MSRYVFDPSLPVQRARLSALFARHDAPACVTDPVVVVPPDPEILVEDAYARGELAGLTAARAELLPVQELLEAAVVAVRHACEIDAAALQTPFADLVTRLCSAVIGAELKLAPEHVLRLIDPAIAALTIDAEIVLRLNPLDAALIDEHVTLPLGCIADENVARGSVLVEAPRFVIANSFASRLATVLEGLPCN